MAVRGWRSGVVVLVVLALSACGFHLRGVQPGVAGLSVQVVSATPFGELEQLLADGIRQADMTVVDAASDANMVVQLRSERLTRRVQTVNTTGRASDYELILSVEYVLASPSATADIPARKLESRREYNFSNTELLGKAEEESLLVQEMRRDIVSRLLRQLAYQAADLPADRDQVN